MIDPEPVNVRYSLHPDSGGSMAALGAQIGLSRPCCFSVTLSADWGLAWRFAITTSHKALRAANS